MHKIAITPHRKSIIYTVNTDHITLYTQKRLFFTMCAMYNVSITIMYYVELQLIISNVLNVKTLNTSVRGTYTIIISRLI